ncbi:MAG: hypothetical protein FJW68_09090, partial [Actinobacteria bacterium]|nr:hypothetical protein [Actinomycetota bacterium]
MSHIGLDIGFTGAKAVVFSLEGRILSKSYSDYGSGYKSNLLLKNEIDPYHIISAVKKVLRQCKSTSVKDKPKTIAVSVSGDDLFPADNEGRSVYNVLSAYNRKPVKYRKLILDRLSGPDNIFYQTGQVLETDVLGLPRILWLNDNIDDLFKKTWKFLCWESYINWYMTGFAVTDFSNASRFLTFDIIHKRWAKNILDAFGIPENTMPDAVQAGSFIGKIRAGVAEELNLPPDLNVVAGGFDQATAALGAGIIEPGIFSLGMGTVFASHWIIDEFTKAIIKEMPNNYTKSKYRNKPANALTDSGVSLNTMQNRAKPYPYCGYLMKDMYMGLLCNFNGSNAINWFFDNLAAYEKSRYKNDVYEYFNKQISSSPSNLFFMP